MDAKQLDLSKLADLQALLQLNVNSWNEQELELADILRMLKALQAIVTEIAPKGEQ